MRQQVTAAGFEPAPGRPIPTLNPPSGALQSLTPTAYRSYPHADPQRPEFRLWNALNHSAKPSLILHLKIYKLQKNRQDAAKN